MACATWNCSRLGANLCTPYNYAPCHFMQSHIRKVYACLAVTCHLHFWQNDRDLLRATAVTRGLNGYRNKSQHRKSTLEKKILPPLQQGFKPMTFQSWVQCSNHYAIHAPLTLGNYLTTTPPPRKSLKKAPTEKVVFVTTPCKTDESCTNT